MIQKRIFGVLLAGVGFLLLNSVVLLYSWLPEYRFFRIVSTSVTFPIGMTLLTLIMVAAVKLQKPVRYMAAGVLGVLTLYSIGETFTQFFYGHPYDPWTDLRFLPALFDMILGVTVGPWVAVPILAVGLAIVYFPILGLLSLISAGANRAGYAALSPLVLLLGISVATGFDSSLIGMVAKNLAPSTPAAAAATPGASAPSTARPAPRTNQSFGFPFLEDQDIYLIVIESYGRTLWSNDDHRALIEPFFKESEATLQSRGYHAYSNLLDSPTTGGRSWLADSSLWTGVRIDSQGLYDEMPYSTTKNLMGYVLDAGYRRFLTAPGTSYSSADWRKYYDFDEYYFRHDFGYKGPLFTLGAMPDQFILRHVRDLVAGHKSKSESPVFVTAILVSSHVPFEQIPPYIEDWDGLGDGSIFNTTPMVTFDNNWLSGGEYPEGYTASIRYSLGTTFEFIDRYVDDNALVVVVGDHQPRLPIRERNAGSAVPIHVISKRKKLVKAFEVYGYQQGLIPQQPAPYKGMEKFLPELLSVINGYATTQLVP